MSLATTVFPCLLAELLVEVIYYLRRNMFLPAAVCEKLMHAKKFFLLLSNTADEIYVLDIWMKMICNLVTNGLARLNLPLIFLCIELCQIIYHSTFLMRASHLTLLFALFWSCDFPCIIFLKMLCLTLICGGFLILLLKKILIFS